MLKNQDQRIASEDIRLAEESRPIPENYRSDPALAWIPLTIERNVMKLGNAMSYQCVLV